MNLIFLRHGKAQERSLDIDDDLRRLTNQGVSLLECDMPLLAQYLRHIEQNKAVLILTSPLLRAKETAEILHKYLPTADLKMSENLALGDFFGFTQELIANTDKTLIAVGHNPFFDEWASDLVGEHIAFKKGEAAGFIIDNIEEWRGRLNEVFYPGQYEIATNRILLYNFFLYHFKTINAQMLDFLDKPDDIETIHNFRISIRKYRCLLNLFVPLTNKAQYKLLDNKLKLLLRELALIRELDVLISRVGKCIENDEKSCLAEYLVNLRKEEQERVKAIVEESAYQTAVSEVLEDTMSVFFDKKLKDVTVDLFVKSRIAEWEANLKKRAKALNVKKIEEIHSYRIFWKKLRYALETFEDVAEDNYKEAILSQNHLGKICDCDINIKLIKALKDSGDECIEAEKKRIIQKEKKRMQKHIRLLQS